MTFANSGEDNNWRSAFVVGLFSVPALNVEELVRLDAAAYEASMRYDEDRALRVNEVYDRAVEVCLDRVPLSGWDTFSAFAALAAFIRRRLRLPRDQNVFTPGQVQALSQKLARLEQRLGGEDELVRRVARWGLVVPESVELLYRALKDILARATSKNAGFVWTHRNDDAEAELAEEHRRRERLRQEAEELERMPPPADPKRLMAGLDEYIEEMHLRRVYDEGAGMEGLATAWLCQLPAEEVEALQPLMAEATSRARRGHKHKARGLVETARERARAAALRTVSLRKWHETATIEDLLVRLAESQPGVVVDAGIYTAQQARALRDALKAWEAAGGGEAALASPDSEIVTRLASRAYRAFARTLGGAVRRKAGFACLLEEHALRR